MQNKDFSEMQIKFDQIAEDGSFSGYGSVFDNIDSVGDIVAAGAFARTLKQYGEQKRLPILWQHDSASPIGVYTALNEDSRGLFLQGKLNLEVQQAREAHALLKQGAVSGLSIGYRIKDYDMLNTGVRVIKDLDLFEVSLVTFPANDSARVASVKADEVRTLRELERVLRDAGLSRNDAKIIASSFQPKHQKEDQRDAVNREMVEKKFDQFFQLLQEFQHGSVSDCSQT